MKDLSSVHIPIKTILQRILVYGNEIQRHDILKMKKNGYGTIHLVEAKHQDVPQKDIRCIILSERNNRNDCDHIRTTLDEFISVPYLIDIVCEYNERIIKLYDCDNDAKDYIQGGLNAEVCVPPNSKTSFILGVLYTDKTAEHKQLIVLP